MLNRRSTDLAGFTPWHSCLQIWSAYQLLNCCKRSVAIGLHTLFSSNFESILSVHWPGWLCSIQFVFGSCGDDIWEQYFV